MARWKLMCPHYLNCPGTEWEIKETSMQTRRQMIKKVPVPRYLDTRDVADWNYRWGHPGSSSLIGNEEGEIIVCHEGKGEHRDIVFVGEPTPDMVPVDDEATNISRELSANKWSVRPETLHNGYSQSLIDTFEEKMVLMQTPATKVEGLDELVKSIASMAKTNERLIESMVTNRRV